MVFKKTSNNTIIIGRTKYITATIVACEVGWPRRILKDIQDGDKGPTIIFCDNMSTITVMKNPVFHSRIKHIEIRHQFIWELVENGEIELQFYKIGEQLADIFTKAIMIIFINFRQQLGV